MCFRTSNDRLRHRTHQHMCCSEVTFRKQLQELIHIESWNADREQLRCNSCY